MSIQEAIQLAVDNGFEIEGLYDSKHPCIEDTAVMFINPKFWQSLGESMGRSEQSNYPLEISFGSHRKMWKQSGDEWHYHWHRFIDHLAEGKDIESFFASLNTPKK